MLDKMLAQRDDQQTIQNFIDWYCDEWLGHPGWSQFSHGVGETVREEIMAAYFGIDLKEAERERMALLTDLRQDHKVQDAIKRKADA